jgi:hypothetical protein
VKKNNNKRDKLEKLVYKSLPSFIKGGICKLDMVGSNFYSSNISLILGNGHGNFVKYMTFPVGLMSCTNIWILFMVSYLLYFNYG